MPVLFYSQILPCCKVRACTCAVPALQRAVRAVPDLRLCYSRLPCFIRVLHHAAPRCPAPFWGQKPVIVLHRAGIYYVSVGGVCVFGQKKTWQKKCPGKSVGLAHSRPPNYFIHVSITTPIVSALKNYYTHSARQKRTNRQKRTKVGPKKCRFCRLGGFDGRCRYNSFSRRRRWAWL